MNTKRDFSARGTREPLKGRFPMKRYGAGIRQHNTHSTLAGPGEPGESPRADALSLDAIIVPGARDAAHLDQGVTLARAGQCWLVVLCSGELHGPAVKQYLDERSFTQAIVIDLPSGYSHPLFNFPNLLDIKDRLPAACSHHVTDLSMKRNVGLALAKMLGWRRIFFLDDDIRDIAYPDLQATVNMLSSFSAAGMWVTDFPDNSIVCHANRMTGGPQEVFVSGAALAVDCKNCVGFFPDIYNEDWFFFFDAAAKGQLYHSPLKATHLKYYPFANPDRAASQEFGDVLAEGLYQPLLLQISVEPRSREYWSSFLEERRNFLEEIVSRVDEAPPDMQDEITASLHAAVKCLGEITPDLCARYVEAWRQDLNHWKRRWARIRLMPSVDEALAALGLATTRADTPHRILHPQDRDAAPHAPAPDNVIPDPLEENRSTRPLAVAHEHGRRRKPIWSLITTVQISAIYCQVLALRIFFLRSMRKP
jgi:hypothetical protein